jgi:hypothetical protein
MTSVGDALIELNVDNIAFLLMINLPALSFLMNAYFRFWLSGFDDIYSGTS